MGAALVTAEPSTTAVDSVEAAAAVLYRGPLERFVADRDALAKQARAAGQRELATAIKALRKPTVAAAALNQALQVDPEAVETLLGAVDDLRRAQEGLMTGDAAEDFGDRRAAYRKAVEAIASAAPSHRDEVATAVEAAAVGGLHQELRAAAFALPPQPSGGFGPFEVGPGTVAGAAPSRAKDSDAPAARGPSAAERRLAERARRAAQEALALARADHRAATEAATAAASAVQELDEEVAALSERLDQLRAARDDAVVVRAEAEANLHGASDRLEVARAALDAL